jgi:hypothetical protein
MKTEHTPGPWKVSNDFSGVLIEVENGNTVAKVNALKDEYEANARLIAAAPKLLSTLNSLMMSMSAHPDCTEGSEFDDFVSLAKQAIQEATGSTHNTVNK